MRSILRETLVVLAGAAFWVALAAVVGLPFQPRPTTPAVSFAETLRPAVALLEREGAARVYPAVGQESGGRLRSPKR